MDEEQQKLIEANKGNRSRGWCFTFHKWEPRHWEACCAAPDVKYMLVSQEMGSTGETPHLQGYVWFDQQRTWTAFKAWLDALLGTPKHRFVAARGSALANFVYISKEGREVHEHGERPKSDKEKGEVEKERCKRNLAAVMEGRVDDIDDDILVHHLAKYEYGAAALKRARREKPQELDGVLDNYWIWGPAGTGKDTFVKRKLAGRPFYKKSTEMYWDGYDDEEDVVVADYEGGESRYLKIWCDRHPFDGRRMFGKNQVIIRPKRIWVTSNYHPSALFKGVDAAAVMRRFQIIHLVDGVARHEWRPPVCLPPVAVEVFDAPPSLSDV